MKRAFIIILISSWPLLAHSQSDSVRREVGEPADSTGFGMPTGNAVTREIGSAGGSISSEDGRIELIFPEGALTKISTISIQAATNLAPNGTGYAYRLEPSGTHFERPVELRFHYSEEEADMCHPELMCLAMQDHTGKWSFGYYHEWDSAGNLLRGSIEHFSFVSNVNQIALKPHVDKLRVNNASLFETGEGRAYYTIIELIDLSRRARRYWGDDFQPAPAMIERETPIRWFANGIRDGNQAVGVIVPPVEISNLEVITIERQYGSPSRLPAKNPVVISARIFTYSRKTKSYSKARTVKCKIEIYDEYEVNVNAVFDNTKTKPKLGTTKWVDSAAFDLRIGVKTEIINLRNQLFQLVEENITPTCKFRVLNKDNCTGLVHISGVRSTQISNAAGTGNPRVKINFKQDQFVVMPVMEMICKGRNQPMFPAVIPMAALPWDIEFEMKEEAQKVTNLQGIPEGFGKYEVIVKRKNPPE